MTLDSYVKRYVKLFKQMITNIIIPNLIKFFPFSGECHVLQPKYLISVGPCSFKWKVKIRLGIKDLNVYINWCLNKRPLVRDHHQTCIYRQTLMFC